MIEKYNRPSKLKAKLKNGEARMSGQLNCGVLGDGVSICRQLATKYDLDLTIRTISKSWFHHDFYFEFIGRDFDIVDCKKHLDRILENY